MITFYYRIDDGGIEAMSLAPEELIYDGLAAILVQNGVIDGYLSGASGAKPEIKIIRVEKF